jgi:23S rRNA (cytidine1920-2'-O)/16S rRNA (cytidine1409-2'-O)-methyltransferase
VPLLSVVRRRWPEWDEAAALRAIGSGVLVDGVPVNNPRALVAAGASVRLPAPAPLQGQRKLAWALERFGVDATGAVALDVGASTGGFTTALLQAGARSVYAVDAGHGQLRGRLRQDPRVVNLERTNVSRLGADRVPEPVELVVVDVSYLSLAAATEQVSRAGVVAPGAELLGLVKPMFELRLATIPSEPTVLAQACEAGRTGVARAGWSVLGADECPVRGHRGAVEFFVHAQAAGA